jgi:hypothetical protein
VKDSVKAPAQASAACVAPKCRERATCFRRSRWSTSGQRSDADQLRAPWMLPGRLQLWRTFRLQLLRCHTTMHHLLRTTAQHPLRNSAGVAVERHDSFPSSSGLAESWSALGVYPPSTARPPRFGYKQLSFGENTVFAPKITGYSSLTAYRLRIHCFAIAERMLPTRTILQPINRAESK